MSNTSTLALLALLVVALLATNVPAIPFGYRPLYSSYHCGSYASRLYSYYSGRPLYTCPNFYPAGGCHSSGCGAYNQPYGVPYTRPYIGNGHHTNTGAGPININNMNSVKIDSMNGAAFPATNANPAEQTTSAPMPETETTATGTGSMAAQSGASKV
ncbi:hypothetical protein BC938DRAFT_480008 [Jimgerdemannia flammicorona]|uniref:Uncharacterized protein n=1 Tax=Jimgerdemannia flammicorona TaxID=994334 RepID=A0A433QJN3_9FUNG|nr:hypothetical protein BC938DRAFT_480008 [Jimgerdemannia flammicorona]